MVNESNLFPHDKSSFPIPETLFRKASKLLRTAEYDDPFLFQVALPELRKFSRELLQAKKKDFTEREEVYYLWSLCLQAELHDYAGRPELAQQILAKTGQDLEQKLKEGLLGRSGIEFSKRLFRQQLWTLIFWSHCYYRDEKQLNHLILAKSLLKRIQGQIWQKQKQLMDAGKGDSEPSFGLLARASYSLGQVYRQMSDVKLARREFMAAIEFTRKRLQAKSKKYARHKPDRVREEAYAKYVIAKAFSFGLAWASYHSGELHRARGSAASGCTLLETTHDPVHKAYAQVIYAGVLSAVSRSVRPGQNVPLELVEALSMLRPLAEDVSPLKSVPRLFARARYTLAVALHAADLDDEAEERAHLIYQSTEAGSRWHLECGVLLVRLLLKKERFAEARRQSDELMQWITGPSPVPGDVRFAVLLCHADVLMSTKENDYGEAQELLSQVKVLARRNPLSKALCHLYQARCYHLRGMIEEAHAQLSRWRAMESIIEHGYVHDLADTIKGEIDVDDARLVIDSTVFYQDDGLKQVEARYKEWLIRRLHAKHPKSVPSDEECKKKVGVGKRALELWMQTIGFNPWCNGASSTRSSK